MRMYENSIRLEEMVEFLIRIVGKSNEKLSQMEERIKELETILENQIKNIEID